MDAARAAAKEVLPPAYRPGEVEPRIYRFWLERGFFTAPAVPSRTPFCIVIPPPNVTGSLHIGHALDNTIQDVLVRRRRMQGYDTLWLPGTDHAGIATQVVVERRLAEEGLTRHDLGRQRFLERVWAWKEEYEKRILDQLKRLGASCDWTRTRFTMDPGCSRAVREVFVRLYRKGLIYRGEYIVNWCPRCRTTLADLEVKHVERDGYLYFIRYPLEDGGHITVATTRPETMLGDTGVAVHPEDPRYRHLVGRYALLPVLGRRLPIVADPAVDPEFGTGAVKVTPAHDPADFEIGRRHGLPRVKVIDEDARMTEEAGPFAGLDRYRCREALVERLKAEGLLERVQPHRYAVGTCDRCDTVIEPLVSLQWFVRTKPLAGPAIAAVREGRTRIVPERFEKVYFHWLENIRDWPISRQIWWGHRIPAWYCPQGHVTVASEDPERCETCGSPELQQDPDVLDTWFSSALWPFSTLGWPDDTPELRHYYPTSVLVTGYDILFFWVARMMMMGLEFMGQVPFRTVLLHGLVRDARGQKMSKSRGNVIDPLDVIERYGADALRWALITGTAPGNDVRISEQKLEGARNFINKLWNAARFSLLHLGDFDPGGPVPAYSVVDRWLLSRLRRTVQDADRLLERFELGEAARLLQEFFWGQLCDWYIEMVKPRLAPDHDPADRYAAQHGLWTALDTCLRLLHPFIPFVTEEVWQKLPHRGESLAVAPWPEPRPEWDDPEAEQDVETLIALVRAVRAVRSDFRLEPRQPVALHVRAREREERAVRAHEPLLRRLAGVGEIRYEAPGAPRPAQAAAVVLPGLEAFVPLGGLVDLEAELRRLRAEAEELRRYTEDLERRLQDPLFRERAPEEVVEREEARYREARDRLQRLEARLADLAGA